MGELKRSITCRMAVQAKMDEDGTVTAYVTAHAPYHKDKDGHEMTTSATVEVGVALSAELGAVMQKAMKAAEEALGTKLDDAIYVSRQAGMRFGEVKA